jgi:molybdate transport system regulatory protein
MYRLDLKIRLHNGSDIAIGPGKAELLAAIAEHGSISAAARAMGMSYRRAWLLVETMNRSFKQPLVSTLAGGKHGGGTQLTATGELILQRYQAICAAALVAVQSGCDELAELLAEPTPPAL